MCPDRDLLSAWIDGEVPSPWRETIERHVRACASCSKAAASLSRTRSLFEADSKDLDSVAEGAKERVFASISGDIILRPSGAGPLWARRFSVPIPAAAAAALAIALLSFALVDTGRHNAELKLAMARAVEATPVAASGIGMDSILDFITKQNSAVNINITLPAEAFGGSAGEPFIVREADYKPGSGR